MIKTNIPNKKKKRIIIIGSIIGLIIVVALVLFFVLKKDEVEKDQSTLAKYYAWVYQVDDWKEESQNTGTQYYKTLLVYSKDFYDEPTKEDVLFLTKSGYEMITNVIDNTDVTIYNMNTSSKKGVCAYIKIKSDELIDEEKIYINIEGPVEYVEGITTRDEFVEKYKSDEGWCGLTVSVSDFMVPTDEIGPIQPSKEEGVVTIVGDEETTRCYYKINNNKTVFNNNTALRSMNVDELHENGLEELTNIFPTLYSANMKDGMMEVVENLNENIKIKVELIDGVFWYGYETVAGDNIANYVEELPEYIIATFGNYVNLFKVIN